VSGPQIESVDALVAYLVDSSLKCYSVAELAELLGIKKRFIEDNVSRLPHHKFGRAVSFDAAQVRRIKEMHQVSPLDTQAPAEQGPPSAGTSVLTLTSIRPSAGRRRRPTG
jgi:excisionase family DNA binding protein